MFLSKDQFKEDTTCQRCKTIFVDPRSLPCGECICNKCITNEIGDKNNKFNCFCCNEMHFVPKNGFPVCKVMVSLLKKPFVDIKFSSWESFKKQLQIIKEKLDSLSSSVKLSDEIISEHCGMVKAQIENETESLIQEIEKYREILLKKVDDYEWQCKDNIKKEKSNFESIIKTSSQLFNEYTDYFNKQNIDEAVILKMSRNVTEKTIALQKEINNFNTIVFNRNKIKFNAYQRDHIDSSVIGEIVYEPLKDETSKCLDFTKCSEIIDLKSKIGVHSSSSVDEVVFLENGSIVIVYIGNSGVYNICVFDKDYNSKKNVKFSSIFSDFPYHYNKTSSINNQYPINNIKNEILLIGNSYQRLSILNQDLIVQNYAQSNASYYSVCGNSKIIIGYCKSSSQLDIWDYNLYFLQRVQLHNELAHKPTSSHLYSQTLPLANSVKIQIINRNCIFLNSNEISIVGIDRSCEKPSIIDTSNIKIYQIAIRDDLIHTVVSNKNNQFEVQVFDMKGKLEQSYSLIGFTPDCLLPFSASKIDFCLNKKSLELRKIKV
jgi:hypothetical protein